MSTSTRRILLAVIPAKAGIQLFETVIRRSWTPAFAGMTSKKGGAA